MTTAIRSLYRRVLPHRLRRPLWTTRCYARALFTDRRGEVLRDAWAGVRVAFGRPVALATLADGGQMYVDLRDHGIGRPLFRLGVWEPAETAFMNRFLRPGMTVLDVGANVGYHTLLAAQRVGPGGRVVAFEPDPWNHELLTRNLDLNRAANVVVVRTALGRGPGEAVLARSRSNFGDHRVGVAGPDRVGVSIRIDSLDNQFREIGVGPVDLLKIDVQGYEAEVFAGMADTLRAAPPRAILMEYWPHGIRAAGGDPDAVAAQLAAAGYAPGFLEPDGSITPADPAGLAARVPAAIAATPDEGFVNLVWSR